MGRRTRGIVDFVGKPWWFVGWHPFFGVGVKFSFVCWFDQGTCIETSVVFVNRKRSKGTARL